MSENKKKKNILVHLDEDVYLKIKKYMIDLNIKSWSELFKNYLLHKLEEDINKIKNKEEIHLNYKNIRKEIIEIIEGLKLVKSSMYKSFEDIVRAYFNYKGINTINTDEYNLLISKFPEIKFCFIKEDSSYKLIQ